MQDTNTLAELSQRLSEQVKQPKEVWRPMVDTNTLAELSQRAKQLNEQSDSLSKTIDTLNGQLSTMNIGLDFWLDDKPLIDSGFQYDHTFSPPQKYQFVVCLGFCEVEKKWQLAVRETTTNYVWNRDLDVEEQVREDHLFPLMKAPRDLRLLAAEALDNFLKELSSFVQEKIEVVERAADLAKPK